MRVQTCALLEGSALSMHTAVEVSQRNLGLVSCIYTATEVWIGCQYNFWAPEGAVGEVKSEEALSCHQ